MPTGLKYGTVSDLCAYLGYINTGKGPRSKSTLSTATIDHRRDFLAMKPGLKQFPTDENAAEARECARTFVESRPEFFEDSEEASSCGFPIYPQDKNKIISALTRLMCQQEHTARITIRKKSYKKASNKVTNDSNDPKKVLIHLMSQISSDSDCDTDQEDPSGEWTDDCLKELPTNVCFNDKAFESDSEDNNWDFPGNCSTKLAAKQENELNQEIIDITDDNDHIGADTYEIPLSRKRAYTPSKLATDLELSPTPKKQMTEQWIECMDSSTITEKPGEIELQTAIEDQWNRLKEQYPALKNFCHSPSPELEYPAFHSLCSPISQVDTYQRTATPTLSPVRTSEPTPPAVKKSLIVKLRLPKALRTVPAGYEYDKSNERPQNQALESSQIISIDSRQDKPYSMSSIALKPQKGNDRLPQLVIDANPGNSYADLASETQTNQLHQTSATKLPNNTPMTPQTPMSANQIPAAHGRSISGRASSASLTCEPPAEIPSKPTLQFMFQRPNGRPDRKYLMPRKALFDLSLSELFLVVSGRTDKPLDSLNCVTLRYLGWGEGEALVIQKDSSEEEWEETKEEILIVFQDAIGEYPKRKEFLVWIKCGDRTKMEQKQDMDSGY